MHMHVCTCMYAFVHVLLVCTCVCARTHMHVLYVLQLPCAHTFTQAHTRPPLLEPSLLTVSYPRCHSCNAVACCRSTPSSTPTASSGENKSLVSSNVYVCMPLSLSLALSLSPDFPPLPVSLSSSLYFTGKIFILPHSLFMLANILIYTTST